ncbi:MAG TPA: signal recognition particle-docking protein FtsY [Acidimicrobiales bacterium]|nr:signal recognition particle-docking protein FtsY [Acidimicrobiales bacterium]
MEVVILVLIAFAVVLLVGSVAAIAVNRRRTGGVELEPPPSPARRPPRPRPVQPPAPTVEAPAPAPVGVEPEPEVVEAPPEAPAPRPRFRDRLGKARSLLSGYVGSILSRTDIDDETWDELEEALVRADVGVGATQAILDDLRARVKDENITSSAALLDALKDDLKKQLTQADPSLRFEPGEPNVWLFVGVNGVGKTTTIGKVALQQQQAGRSVLLAAGDTFRAAAGEQLELWAQRVGADIVRGAEGADPGSVVFDAVQHAGARNIDVVLADTAGRLHTKVNLMEELKKVRRVAERDAGKVTEVLLVLDATTGQNGLVQAKQFTDAVEVTGVVLTKLDGTAKGGIAMAIQQDLGIPIKLVGLGEKAEDLVTFDPDEFVEALFA